MKLTCLFDNLFVLLLFLFCWTNIFLDFALDGMYTSTIEYKVSENISPTKEE